MIGQLEKEKAGIVGRRGLQSDNDDQVFSMSIPLELRDSIDKAYAEILDKMASGMTTFEILVLLPFKPLLDKKYMIYI